MSDDDEQCWWCPRPRFDGHTHTMTLDEGRRESGPWQAFGCVDPVGTLADLRSHDSPGDRCSAFPRGLTGLVAISPKDPTHSLPEGVPYPLHDWNYVPTCGALDAVRGEP